MTSNSQPAETPRVPQTRAEIVAAAARRGLVILPECMDGVADNLALLARHAAILGSAPLSDTQP